MGMNRLPAPFADGYGELPARYYTRPDQSTETSALMDTVGADWFGKNNYLTWNSTTSSTAPPLMCMFSPTGPALTNFHRTVGKAPR